MTFQPRTDDEILKRIADLKSGDIMGFVRGDLADYLPEDRLSEAGFTLKEGAVWTQLPRDRDSIVSQIVGYLPFAWEKASNRRGLSAGRSICHMQAWLWMLGEDAVADAIEDYSLYGKPQLRELSIRFGFDWEKHDDDEWSNDSNSDGVPAANVDRLTLPWATSTAAEG